MPVHHPLGFKQHPLEDAGINKYITLLDSWHGSIQAMLPGQGLLPSSICHITVTPAPALMQSKPLNEDDATKEANAPKRAICRSKTMKFWRMQSYIIIQECTPVKG